MPKALQCFDSGLGKRLRLRLSKSLGPIVRCLGSLTLRSTAITLLLRANRNAKKAGASVFGAKRRRIRWLADCGSSEIDRYLGMPRDLPREIVNVLYPLSESWKRERWDRSDCL